MTAPQSAIGNRQSAMAKPELLAPAGDWEALKAAVANGADAVYFGLPQFNARHRATNFTPEELPKLMDYLHARGVRGYVTFNTLIFTDELPAAIEYLNTIVAAEVDAVIVQDLGLALLIQRLFPTLHVHASTQTTQTEAAGIEMLGTLGIQRVILARELSVTDIKKIRAATPMPVEVFVHGALCVAYSGQCLTSEALGGRSANRGQCAQACRQPYELFVDGERKELGDRAYLISPQDLAAYDLVDDLAAAGVCSLKIEGRLKGGPYVAAATRTYRAAIDATATGQPFNLEERARLDLEQTFSRGLFHGFLDGVNHQLTTPARFPKHRGVKLGTVVGSTGLGVLVELEPRGLPLEEQIKPGDGVVFDEARPEEEEPGGRVAAVSSFPPRGGGTEGGVSSPRRVAGRGPQTPLPNPPLRKGREPEVVELRFRREDVNPEAVRPGSLVWKTDDPAVRRRLEATYAQDKPIDRQPVDFTLNGELGGVLELRVTTQAGQSASATWPGPLVVAQKHPATLALVREQLDRLGETPFSLGQVQLQLPANVLIPKSVLNDLRRQVTTALSVSTFVASEPVPVSRLQELRTSVSGSLPPGGGGLGRGGQDLTRYPPPPQPSPSSGEGARLYVLARTVEQVRALAEWPFTEGHRPPLIYCDFEDVRRYRDAVAIAREHGLPIFLATLRIIKPGEETWLNMLAEAQPDGVLIRNLAGLAYYRQHHPELPLVGDFSLNVANDLTAAWYRQQGLMRLVPGFDLNWEQLAALVKASDPAWFEPVIHYRMPMFHMEHCVFAAFLSEGKDWRDCGRPCDVHRLDVKDPTGASFPVIPDAGCRNTIYNQLPQSGAEYVGRMVKLGLRHFRLELLRETASEVGPLVSLYQQVLAGQADGAKAWRSVRALNQLGVTRGTLQLL